jgi:hypothetical protein
VGLVFHALASDGGTEVIERNFPGDRKRIRWFASTLALDMVRKKIDVKSVSALSFPSLASLRSAPLRSTES